LPVLVSFNQGHSLGNNPYIMESTEAFTWLVTSFSMITYLLK